MPDPLPAEERRSPQIVVIGQFTRSEYASLLRHIAARVRPEQFQASGSITALPAADGSEKSADHPRLIIVLQTWPEEFSQSQVYDLLDREPLARLLVCFGPWCDSDGRSRDVWPAATRISLTQAEARLDQELAVFRGGTELLPLTASRDECYRCDYPATIPVLPSELSVTVQTPDPAIRDWLSVFLASQGCTLTSNLRLDTDLLIWDVDPWCAAAAQQLVSVHQQFPGLLIVAIVGFARAHEIEQLQQCGVAAVVTKTSSSQELLRIISTAAAPGGDRPSRSLSHNTIGDEA